MSCSTSTATAPPSAPLHRGAALDRNGNGRIDNGKELFGDQHGAANGFQALAAFDGNRDGSIDARDAVYGDLRLLGGDTTHGPQLRTLSQAGIRAIALDYHDAAQALNAYDRIGQLGKFYRTDDSVGTVGDLLLGYRAHA